MEPDYLKELAETTARAKSNSKRLDAVEKRQENLTRLTEAVAVMKSETERTSEDVKEIKTDVKAIMEKPAKRWDALVAAIFTAVAGFIIGMLFKGGV